MALILTDNEVKETVSMEAMLDAVEDLHLHYARGEAYLLERRNMAVGNGKLALMGGALSYKGLYGAKTYTTVDGYQQYHVTLYDARSGKLLAFVHANWLGALRTGATTGVAVRHLANPEAQVLGVIGTGYQAQTQVMGATQGSNLRQIKVFSRRPEPREQFARHMSNILGREVEAVDSNRRAVEGSDIVVCLTTSAEPVLDGDWLKEGALLVSAGPVTLNAREVDETSIKRASLIAVDSLEQARYESGDLVAAVDNGVIGWDQVVELSQIVAGLVPGRRKPSDNIYVKHFGIGVVDIAAAKLAYDLATERGVGLRVDI